MTLASEDIITCFTMGMNGTPSGGSLRLVVDDKWTYLYLGSSQWGETLRILRTVYIWMLKILKFDWNKFNPVNLQEVLITRDDNIRVG